MAFEDRVSINRSGSKLPVLVHDSTGQEPVTVAAKRRGTLKPLDDPSAIVKDRSERMEKKKPKLPAVLDKVWKVPHPMDLLPSEEPIQLLTPDGELQENKDYPLDLSDEDFRSLYRYLILTRRIDKEGINLQRQGQLGIYTSCLGQEGAQVGSAYALGREDWIFPSYREHGVARVREVDPVRLFHHSRGTWISDHDPREWRFAPQTVPIATHLVHAAGLAMAAKFDGDPIVVIAYFGDGANSEGDAHEGMNFASIFGAPLIFFCQNNGWALSVPVERQISAPTIAHRGISYGMPGVRIDGNDVLASYAVTKKLVERARNGGGPALIEALTYRMEAHSTADDPTRYVPQEEHDQWASQDPISRFETFMKDRELLNSELVDGVEKEALEMSTRVRNELYDAPHGDPLEVFDHVYVDPPRHFERQREQLRGEIERLRATDGEED